MARLIKAGSRKVTPKTLSKIREKPGMSNAGKYKNVAAGNFAGPNGTFPIDTKARARNALTRLHFAAPSARAGIKSKIYKKYPDLKDV